MLPFNRHNPHKFSFNEHTQVDTLPFGTYQVTENDWGEPELGLTTRVTDNIILPEDGVVSDVISEIKDFWSKEALYRKYGLIYKRGFLLYGEPGCGKSTVLNLIENELKSMNAYGFELEPWNLSVTARAMQQLRKHTKAPFVVFVEDLDNYGGVHETHLLAVLDGARQVDNVVWIATTNYIDRLAPRMVKRPSRFDLKREVKYPSVDTRQRYFQALDNTNKGYKDWANRTAGMNFAELKELFILVRVLGVPFADAKKRVKKLTEGP